jgi:hypothetical protein
MATRQPKTTFGTKLHADGFTQTVYPPGNPISVLTCAKLQVLQPEPRSKRREMHTNASSGCVSRCLDRYDHRQLRTGIRQLHLAGDSGHYGIRSPGNPAGNPSSLIQHAFPPSFRPRDGILSLRLPNDQWIQELNHFFAMGMNTTQRWATEFATGPPGAYASHTTTAGYSAIDPSTEWICNNRIIRDDKYTSFSTLWISLTFELGALLILVT